MGKAEELRDELRKRFLDEKFAAVAIVFDPESNQVFVGYSCGHGHALDMMNIAKKLVYENFLKADSPQPTEEKCTKQ